MKIIGFLLLIAFMAKNGHCLSLPFDEVDHSQVQQKLIEDLKELLELKNMTTPAPTTSSPVTALPKEVAESMKEDLEMILKYNRLDEPQLTMDEPANDPRRRWPKPKPGQIISKCSYYKYGCCQDGKTKADGPHRAGCGLKLCSDERPAYCQNLRRSGELSCKGEHYSLCAYECGNCKPPAPAKLSQCIARLNPWGCCFDGTPALGPNKKGCRPCVDVHRHVCGQFRFVSNGCKSGSYGIRTFMNKYCPRTCDKCHTYYYVKK